MAPFAEALLRRDRTVPAGLSARRFAVYRNNVHAGLVEALGFRFPVTRALVGDAFFRAAAGEFVELSPPRSPLLFRWGDDFPVFLELFPPARGLPYLPDVACLEAARTEAYHAADAPGDLAALGAEGLASLRLGLPPSGGPG